MYSTSTTHSTRLHIKYTNFVLLYYQTAFSVQSLSFLVRKQVVLTLTTPTRKMFQLGYTNMRSQTEN